MENGKLIEIITWKINRDILVFAGTTERVTEYYKTVTLKTVNILKSVLATFRLYCTL
jgi:hypothetical protein